MKDWTFTRPSGDFRVRVNGNLVSNTVETILSAVQDGVGIGMFYRASLVDGLQSQEIVNVLDEFIGETRDVSLIWPNRRFISERVRQVTDFFGKALAERI